MSQKLSLAEIRNYWHEQAVQHGQSPAASWSDVHAIELEIRELAGRLADGDRVLDVGCANGYSTVQLAAQRRIDIRGLDYIPEMIAQAKRRLADLPGNLLGRVTFDVGDITALNEPAAAYDKVVVIRVLINLRNWDLQLKGLRECARVLKQGGLLLLSEATLQGWRKLNAFRAEWGLDAIPMPGFNEYLDEERVTHAVPELESLEICNFASTYFVGTRVLKPLLNQALGQRGDAANPLMEWNRFWALLPPAGDYGTQKLFVFRKR
jgi:ubiquinone/menaquinone biosynthesis C-methylase UbiE